ncbi:hypothetical protein OEZ85_005933 [Tetradesmus obliquus]|uniref:Casein kinase substrate phosphoprotein PP28 domain-containing protein n=1 Tax=Tetradesmus obliquus TaxID=3088 RepID=A0ABY8UID0_TETOB|nr:hypothetical protein OEZ85_005933 [Tetradesmus obliquus]
MSKKKVMDALDALSDDSDDTGSESSEEEEQQKAAEQAPAKKQKTDITLEDLQKQGYSSGPSVLYMKPPEETGQANWAWSDGKALKPKEDAEESYEERQRTHEAATTAAEEAARLAMKAQQHAARLRDEARQEREEMNRKSKAESFALKEKRKRDAGMQSRGKSTVEEEKRIARQFGVYSGFD